MIAMGNEPSMSLRRALMACVCGPFLVLPMAASAQQAQDDDKDTFEQKIIKNILGGMGVDVGRAGIDYRERSPLVIPPTRDLPPPQATGSAARNPARPPEPDRKLAGRSKPDARPNPNEPGTESPPSPADFPRWANPR